MTVISNVVVVATALKHFVEKKADVNDFRQEKLDFENTRKQAKFSRKISFIWYLKWNETTMFFKNAPTDFFH